VITFHPSIQLSNWGVEFFRVNNSSN